MNVAIKKANNNLSASSKNEGRKHRFPLRNSNNKANSKNMAIDHVPVTRSMRKQSANENMNVEEVSSEPVKRQLNKRPKKQKIQQVLAVDENKLDSHDYYDWENYKYDCQLDVKEKHDNSFLDNSFSVANLHKDEIDSANSSAKETSRFLIEREKIGNSLSHYKLSRSCSPLNLDSSPTERKLRIQDDHSNEKLDKEIDQSSLAQLTHTNRVFSDMTNRVPDTPLNEI